MALQIYTALFCVSMVVDALYINVPCITRSGTSSISCDSTETMVSCGFSQDGIQGTLIENNICTAYPNGKTAMARCCTFPSDAISNVFPVTSASGSSVSATCPSESVLTGCDPRHVSGVIKMFKGSWTGPLSSPPQSASWIPTENQCHAESWTIATIEARARCLSFNPRYTLECKTKAILASHSNFGKCESGYSMMACNAWTDSAVDTDTLDLYYVDGNDACKVRQTGFEALQANAICCRLNQGSTTSTTASPTPKPTANPTANPTTNPTAKPTGTPTKATVVSTNPVFSATATKYVWMTNTQSSTKQHDSLKENESVWTVWYIAFTSLIAIVIGCVCVLCACIAYRLKRDQSMKDERIMRPKNQPKEPQILAVQTAQLVAHWLIKDVQLPQYLPMFLENGYDSLALISRLIVDTKELKEIGVEDENHQAFLLQHISKLNVNSDRKYTESYQGWKETIQTNDHRDTVGGEDSVQYAWAPEGVTDKFPAIDDMYVTHHNNPETQGNAAITGGGDGKIP